MLYQKLKVLIIFYTSKDFLTLSIIMSEILGLLLSLLITKKSINKQLLPHNIFIGKNSNKYIDIKANYKTFLMSNFSSFTQTRN